MFLELIFASFLSVQDVPQQPPLIIFPYTGKLFYIEETQQLQFCVISPQTENNILCWELDPNKIKRIEKEDTKT